jgi:hypothetical protein
MPLLPCFKLSTISVAAFSSARHLLFTSKVTAIASKALSLNTFGCPEAPCFAFTAEANQKIHHPLHYQRNPTQKKELNLATP